MSSVFNQLTFKRQPDIQYKSKEEIAAFQNERLQEQMAYVYANSPYYKRVFDENHVSPEDIKTVDDLQRLPVTTKNAHFPGYRYSMRQIALYPSRHSLADPL